MQKVRLFCLPYAGGSAAAIYLSWKKNLEQNIEVIPLELAGRGKRIREPLCTSVEEIVKDLIEKTKLLLHGDQPYSIFGHSMGGLLAYEFCRKIIELNLPLPNNLIVSGFHPPNIKLEGDIHLLPIDEFADKMRKKGNIPASIFENRDLYNIFIPILYADYKLVFNYVFNPQREKLNTDLHLFTGKSDYIVYQNRKEWSLHTNGSFQDHIFEGGHFFIRESEKKVQERLSSILSI